MVLTAYQIALAACFIIKAAHWDFDNGWLGKSSARKNALFQSAGKANTMMNDHVKSDCEEE